MVPLKPRAWGKCIYTCPRSLACFSILSSAAHCDTARKFNPSLWSRRIKLAIEVISNSAIRGVEWASLLSELVLAHFLSSPPFLSFIFPRVDVKGLRCHVSPWQFGCQLKMWSQSWMLRDVGIFVGGWWTLQSPW